MLSEIKQFILKPVQNEHRDDRRYLEPFMRLPMIKAKWISELKAWGFYSKPDTFDDFLALYQRDYSELTIERSALATNPDSRLQSIERDTKKAFEHSINLIEYRLLKTLLGQDIKLLEQGTKNIMNDSRFLSEGELSHSKKFHKRLIKTEESEKKDRSDTKEILKTPGQYLVSDIFDASDDGYSTAEVKKYLKLATKYIKYRDGKENVKRGDLLTHEFTSYRNDDVFIYNKSVFIDLATEPDEYGTVPKKFHGITQFPIDYWSESIQHNNYIYIPSLTSSMTQQASSRSMQSMGIEISTAISLDSVEPEIKSRLSDAIEETDYDSDVQFYRLTYGETVIYCISDRQVVLDNYFQYDGHDILINLRE